MSDTVSTGEAAIMLGVTPQTVRNYLDRGYLTGHTLPSGQRRVDVASVLRMREEVSK